MHTVFDRTVMAQRYGYLNLDLAAQMWLTERGHTLRTKILKSPQVAHEMEEDSHARFGLKWSHGGWMEDRSVLRRGSYLDEKELYLHLGIDLNVNPRTMVYSTVQGTVVYVGDDSHTFGTGGWGNHCILYIENLRMALLYAHLGHIGKQLVGMEVAPGTPLSTVGETHENGGWRPHLHMQLVRMPPECVHWTTKSWERFSEEIDGYARLDTLAESARRYPDPTPLIFGHTVW
ncbi:MAG: peptidoglycan DD-metalloendopeptidase family protein [Candidatus Pacebacteria bacterium]|nr:peptidoglycan DD-metalloendopeptidase family protein [Candidatus Paceibacterota bacterium]